MDSREMEERIAQALGVLVGTPLWGAGRAADLVWFQFGERRTVQRRGAGAQLVGSVALHVQCEWRLKGPVDIVVDSADDSILAEDDPFREHSDSDRDRPGARRLDERIARFFEARASDPIIVNAIYVGEAGAFRLSFQDGFMLEVSPDNSLDSEHWRLLQPATEVEHFVVTGHGIEE